MNYGFDLYSRIACSEQEKDDCFELIKIFIDLKNRGKKHGLLSLEDDIPKIGKKLNNFDLSDRKIFEKAVQLLINSGNISIIQHIIELHIMTGNYKGKSLLAKLIIFEGIYFLNDHIGIVVFSELMFALFPIEYESKLSNFFDKYLNKIEQDNMNELLSQAPQSNSTNLLERHFVKMTDEKIRELLKKVDATFLTISLKGSSGIVVSKIFRNISKRASMVFMEDMDFMGRIDQDQIINAQMKILEVMESLGLMQE